MADDIDEIEEIGEIDEEMLEAFQSLAEEELQSSS